MKRTIAFMLVLALAIACVPAFAAPASNKAENTMEMQPAFDQISVDNSGNIVKASEMRATKTETMDGISEQYQSVSLSSLKASTLYAEVKGIGFEEIAPEDASEYGYLLEKSDFEEVTDYYTTPGASPVYLQKFLPTEGEMVKAYAKGQTFFMNFDLGQIVNDQLTDLPEKEDGYAMSVVCYAGQAEGENISFLSVARYSSTEGGISFRLTAPEDDTYFMFIIVIDEYEALKNVDFGGWFVASSLDAKAVAFKNVAKGADMKVGEKAVTKVASNETSLTVAPSYTSYVPTYAQAHKITLEGGEHYVAQVRGNDAIGAHVYFCDENMDVLAETFISALAIENGYTYDMVDMKVWPAESGTYYMVVAGYDMTDEGTLDLTVAEWETTDAYELHDVNMEIDLGNLTDGYIETIGEDEIWGYFDQGDGAGHLILAYPGTYTLKGSASNVFVTAFDGIRVIYDNATTGAVRLMNAVAPVSLESKGTSAITDEEYWGYTVFNVEGARAGVYMVGENFTVEGIFGLVMEGAPLHLAAKSLTVDTSSMEGYYPIAVWVIGQNLPALTLGKNAKFDGDNKVAKMYYDPNSNFTYGYTVAADAELYRYDNTPDWDSASLSFVLTTEGLGGGAGMLGDVNLDGNINTGDAVMILRHVAQLSTLEGEALANADVNGDGNVNTGDAVKVLRHVAGLETIGG